MRDSETLDESMRYRGARASVEVEADVLEHDFDAQDLGEPVAAAIAEAIRAGIRGIGQRASAATVEYRERAKAALARGAGWAVRRYGTRTPDVTDRLFNDSGALADLKAEAVGDEWRIVTPPQRTDTPRTFTGGEFEAMLARLRQLVPALRDPLSVPAVQRAIEESAGQVARVRRRR